MPFRSKSQQRYMFWAEKQGKLPGGTAKRWARHTPNMSKLPERASVLSEMKKRIKKKTKVV